MDPQIKSDIDKYNIFELLGLQDMKEERKKQMLLEINETIWSEFLFLRLDKILPQEDILEVKAMIDKSESMEKILEFIESKAPNFYQLLLEYTRKSKIELIDSHFDQDIEDITEAVDSTTDPGKKTNLKRRIEKYKIAKNYLKEGNFEDLKSLMAT